jgi:hypothetical protein
MRSLSLLASIAAAALAATGLEAQNPNPFTWRGAVGQGKTLEVRGIQGWIRAERATGNQAEVTAQKTGDEDDPDDVRIEVIEDGEGVLICAVYPGRNNRCGRDGDHQRIRRHNDVEVQYTVRVPAGVDFVGSMVSGDVAATGLPGRVDVSSVSGSATATGIGGPVSANSVSGDVELETASGEASGRSVSGSVRATVRGRGDRALRFSSVSGDVTLMLPRDLGADLELSTLSGELQSDYPVTVSGRFSRRRMQARIGAGGRRLEVSTVSGDVRIRALP